VPSDWYTSDSATFVASGTSMSSPHVAGAAALVLAASPASSPAQVAQALTGHATVDVLGALGPGSPNRLLFTNFTGGASSVPTPNSPPAPVPTPPAGPTASFTVSCPGGRSACNFDARASTAPAGLANYAWSFGDGGAARSLSSATTSYNYRAADTYTVTLTVSDSLGRVAVTSQRVRIRRL
jgi:serine protease